MRALRCSFCHKKDTEVSKLVAGPRAFICDECVAVASRLMEQPPNPLPPPDRVSLRQRVSGCIGRLLSRDGHGTQSLAGS